MVFQVGFIREAFPLRSKNDVELVLQSCEYNIEAAISCFAKGKYTLSYFANFFNILIQNLCRI